MKAQEIINKYIAFFEKRGHKRITNSPLVPENDPTTLFTSSGMQPLVPYLLGESHPQGKRLVNVQNCFRAQDIDEVGDNRHTTFFRMLGNWSLGDYFKKEQLPWFFEFLTNKTEGLGLDPKRLFVTAFKGNDQIRQDKESIEIWQKLFREKGIDAKINERIFLYDVDKNWWSRSGTPEKMPSGEPGGADSEVFYRFDISHNPKFGKECHPNCQCGRFMEIGNSVFMQYKKIDETTFAELPNKNVDFGGGLERLLAAVENKNDVFQTSLFGSIVRTIELLTGKKYDDSQKNIRVVVDHIVASVFIINSGIIPSNKEQGYVLRRLLRRGFDNYYTLCISRHSGSSAALSSLPKGLSRISLNHGDSGVATLPRMTIGDDIVPVIESIVKQYKETDPELETNYEKIKNTILEEKDAYETTLKKAKIYLAKKYKALGDELKGQVEISPEDAFALYSTHGLSPSQIKSLGFIFDDKAFAQKMIEHQSLSRMSANKKFKGGLADQRAKTIMGHTATHLLHQAIRDVLGTHVHQTGSNITTERIRFDFNYDKKLTDEEIQKVEDMVNEKIKENLPVHFEMMPLKKAKEIGAIGLFDEKYQKNVKIYFIGGPSTHSVRSGRPRSEYYSVEFCGGPHVDFTGTLKRFKIIKQENIGKGQRRLYAIVGEL